MLHCLGRCHLTLDHGARDTGKHAVEIANDAIHPAFLARDLFCFSLKPVQFSSRSTPVNEPRKGPSWLSPLSIRSKSTKT